MEKKYDALIELNVDKKTFFRSNNTFVIPNPMQLTKQKTTVQNKAAGAVRRVAPIKDFERLVEIWTLIKKEYPDWRLDIYGDDYFGTQKKYKNK